MTWQIIIFKERKTWILFVESCSTSGKKNPPNSSPSGSKGIISTSSIWIPKGKIWRIYFITHILTLILKSTQGLNWLNGKSLWNPRKPRSWKKIWKESNGILFSCCCQQHVVDFMGSTGLSLKDFREVNRIKFDLIETWLFM